MGLFKISIANLSVAGETCEKLPAQDTSFAKSVDSVSQTNAISLNKMKDLKHAVHFKLLKLLLFQNLVAYPFYGNCLCVESFIINQDWLLYCFSPEKYVKFNHDKSCNWYFHISWCIFIQKFVIFVLEKQITFGPSNDFLNARLSFAAVFSALWRFLTTAPNVLFFRT